LSISGGIVSELGDPVRTVTLQLSGTSSQSLTTGNDGLYHFDVNQGGNYTITPSKNNDVNYVNGISTLDILLIQRQILAIQNLGSPYKIIAADVNGSNSVTTFDIVLIRMMILNIRQDFPNGRLWAFVRSDFRFLNPLRPFPYDNFRSYTNLSSAQTDQDFIGIKLGDVNNTWNPGIAKMEAAGEVHFRMNEYHALPGEEVTVPVMVKDFKNITGYQFTLSWDADVVTLTEINNRALNGFFGENETAAGFLTTVWYGESAQPVTLADDDIAFELKFKVIGDNGATTPIKIGSEITPQEAYNENLDLLTVTSTDGMVKVGHITEAYHQQSELYHLSVVPNPFTNSASILFTIPKDETVSIVIYDVLGKEIKHILGMFPGGDYSINWDGDDDSGKTLPSGLYHIGMDAGEFSKRLKVLLIR